MRLFSLIGGCRRRDRKIPGRAHWLTSFAKPMRSRFSERSLSQKLENNCRRQMTPTSALYTHMYTYTSQTHVCTRTPKYTHSPSNTKEPMLQDCNPYHFSITSELIFCLLNYGCHSQKSKECSHKSRRASVFWWYEDVRNTLRLVGCFGKTVGIKRKTGFFFSGHITIVRQSCLEERVLLRQICVWNWRSLFFITVNNLHSPHTNVKKRKAYCWPSARDDNERFCLVQWRS